VVKRIRRGDLPSDTVALARALIGKILTHETGDGRASGRIVETEAYIVGDASSHAFRGPTRRNGSMFLERGHAYVYRIYGTWFCINVASESAGIGTAVLLRALQPIDGVALMQQRRGVSNLLDLARGPGRLAQALAIDLSHDGIDLCTSRSLWLGTSGADEPALGESKRIGITKDADRVLRFYERGNDFVSGPRRMRV
jgi:DNA-3-methyladenine glycosylase